jgi:hypothetical protein
MRNNATQQEIIDHAIAAEKALEACAELWRTGMKARLISSKEYKKICNIGKDVQSIRSNSKEDLFRRFGSDVSEEAMPNKTHYGFS